MENRSICIFCGSSAGNQAVYADAARGLGRILADSSITMVFGGGKVGIMGILADVILEAGGKCIGVMPEDIVALEIAHENLTELHIVKSMHERKELMAKLSDAFIAFPGGLGTLDELSEILTYNQLRICDKPVGILNVNGYFNGLMKFIEHGVGEGFIREEHANNLIVSDDPDELILALSRYVPVSMEAWITDIKKHSFR